ncbi:hypothetical protein V7095_19990 [Bacillus thuringiensis]
MTESLYEIAGNLNEETRLMEGLQEEFNLYTCPSTPCTIHCN